MHRLLREILDATADESGPELKIMEDNQSSMVDRILGHLDACNKHIDIKYHHIRDEVKRGEVKLEYCETTVKLADIIRP